MNLHLHIRIDAPKGGARRLALLFAVPLGMVGAGVALAHAGSFGVLLPQATPAPIDAGWIKTGTAISSADLSANLVGLQDQITSLQTALAGQMDAAIAPVITAWQSYTPTVSVSTAAPTTAFFRRVGDTVDVRLTTTFTACTPTTNPLTWSLPPNLTADMSKTTTVPSEVIGAGTVWPEVDAGLPLARSAAVTLQNTTQVAIDLVGNQPGGLRCPDLMISGNNSATVKIYFSFPIVGWDDAGI